MRLFRVRCLALNYLLFWRRMSNGELFRFSIISKNIIIVCHRGFANFIGEEGLGREVTIFCWRKNELWDIFE